MKANPISQEERAAPSAACTHEHRFLCICDEGWFCEDCKTCVPLDEFYGDANA